MNYIYFSHAASRLYDVNFRVASRRSSSWPFICSAVMSLLRDPLQPLLQGGGPESVSGWRQTYHFQWPRPLGRPRPFQKTLGARWRAKWAIIGVLISLRWSRRPCWRGAGRFNVWIILRGWTGNGLSRKRAQKSYLPIYCALWWLESDVTAATLTAQVPQQFVYIYSND